MTDDMPPDLPVRLRRWSRGLPGLEPAVRLLETTPWLADERFTTECVVVVDDDIACLDWSAARGFLAGHDDADPDARHALQLACAVARRAWDPGLPTAGRTGASSR